MPNPDDIDTQEMTLERRLNALWCVVNFMQTDIETLTKACFMLNERLVAVNQAVAEILAEKRNS